MPPRIKAHSREESAWTGLKYVNCLFILTVGRAGNQEGALLTGNFINAQRQQQSEGFLDSNTWLPGFQETEDHIQLWGHVRSTAPSEEASRGFFSVQFTQKTYKSGKIKVVSLQQVSNRGILHLRPGT